MVLHCSLAGLLVEQPLMGNFISGWRVVSGGTAWGFVLFLRVYVEKDVVIENVVAVIMMFTEIEVNLCTFR